MAETPISEPNGPDAPTLTRTPPVMGEDFGPVTDEHQLDGLNGRGRSRTRMGRVTGAMRRHLVRVIAVVVLLLAGAGVGTWLLTRSSGSNYVLASAGTGTVQQSDSATSTIEAVNQADLDFAIAGKVATVNVVVGQQVAAGAVLATLNPASLEATVAQDEAAVAGDESKLQTDESGGSLASAQQALSTAQQQVILEQQQIAADQTAITNDQTDLTETTDSNQISLLQAQDAVTNAQTKLTSDETTLSNDEGTLSTAEGNLETAQGQYQADGCPEPFPSAQPSGPPCSSDWTAVNGAQNTVNADSSKVTSDANTDTQDQQALQIDQLSLQSQQVKNAQALTNAQQAITTAKQTLSNAQVTLQNDEQTVINDQNNIPNDQGSQSAAIESDEASLEAANVTLQSAQSNLTGATLTAPVAGTVTEVNVAVGNEATAGSSEIGSAAASSSSSSSSSGSGGSSPTYAIEIVGTAAFDATASISSADVSQLQVGDQAQLTVSGSNTPVYGTVSSIGIVATVSSGVATFPVTIAVTGTPSGLYSGMTAQTSIIILDRSGVLTVPSSAVHTVGAASFVYELKNGKEVEHPVAVGAVGTTLTQITSGLKSGDKIVLANLSTPISSGSTNPSSRFGGGGFGGLGGGGFNFSPSGGARTFGGGGGNF